MEEFIVSPVGQSSLEESSTLSLVQPLQPLQHSSVLDTIYAYIYVIYDNTSNAQRSFAMRVNCIEYSETAWKEYYRKHFQGSAVYMACLLSSKQIKKADLFSYPRRKCLLLNGKIKAKSLFIGMTLDSADILVHIICVELNYHFGDRTCQLPEHKDNFDLYMNIPGRYFMPLKYTTPKDYGASVYTRQLPIRQSSNVTRNIGSRINRSKTRAQ